MTGSAIMTEPPEMTVPTSASDDDSKTLVLWRHKWAILAVALVVGLAAGGVAYLSPTSYTAQSTIQVSLLQSENVGDQNALAANELAAQYAQLADSQPVLEAAGRRLTADERSGLRDAIDAGPLNSYNIIGITAEASTATAAAHRAVQVARALKTYVDDIIDAGLSRANQAADSRLRTLDAQITRAQSDISSFSALARGRSTTAAALATTKLASAQNLLASLLSLRENVYGASQRSLVQSQPQLNVINEPSRGSAGPEYAPVYALIGLVVGGFAAAQVILISARVRRSTRT